MNGVVVSSLVRNGAVHKDGRLHAGDFILSVNNESMRNITNSQARAILRRTQLVSTDVRSVQEHFFRWYKELELGGSGCSWHPLCYLVCESGRDCAFTA